MTGQWELKELKGPQRIRPETHWFQSTRLRKRVGDDSCGRGDGGLWFSLQFKQARAEEFYQSLCELIGAGARIAPTSRKALEYALDLGEFDTIGTDIYVPKMAFDALEKLSQEGAFEITDAGLAVEGEVKDCPEFKICSRDAEEPAKSTPAPIPEDSPVIIATIDDGIGIANYRFRQTAKTTRIKHFLDLALIGKPNGGVDELLGRSWEGADIDKLLGQDEEQVYGALGLTDNISQLRQPLRAAVTHGTHVLDLAAGYDWRTQAEAAKAASRPIIAVQMPTQVGQTRSDTWLPQSLKRALDWILVKADELSAELSERPGPGEKPRRLPLVVNGSFASMAGPQDGCSDVERRITQFIKTYRGRGSEDLCTFVLSAGNSLQLRGQAQMDVDKGESKEIRWRVQPDGKTPSFVEIWLRKVDDVENPQQVKVWLVPPPANAPANPLASKLSKAVDWKIGEDVLARVYHQRFLRSDGSRECITIAIRQTAQDQEGEPVVPSGQWHIRIENIGARNLKNVDLQVHLNEVGMFSRSGARQSYFDDRRYEMFDPASGRIINNEKKDPTSGTRVTRQGTLSSYAYAEGALVVGGYRLSDRQPAIYSSSGGRGKDRPRGATGKPLYGPDLAAVSEESPALTGVLAAGTYSGSVALLAGTSVAAPQVSRAVADQIAKCATARQSQAITAGKTPEAVEELKAEVAKKENEENKKKEEERAATAAAPSLGPQYEQVTQPRPLRYGVGRRSFESSYPKRIGD
jgi:hypothetical protein